MEEQQEKSIYQFKISKEYKEYIDDLVRMGTIQIIANMMFYVSNPIDNKVFSEMFGKTLLFILLGVSVYWLIIKKLIIYTELLILGASCTANLSLLFWFLQIDLSTQKKTSL